MFDYLQYFGLACIPAFLALDLVYRARSYETPRYWRLYGLAVTIVVVGISMGTALVWGTFLEGVSLFDGRGLGIAGGAAVGVLVYEFMHYGYHRLAHEWPVLWRLGHQMHHAPESVDAFGANYLHPIDIFFFSTWSSLVFFPLLGLTPEAGVLGSAFLGFNAVFQHANIRTPRWLGYIIQRPESHGIHHGRSIHAYNYADLPIIDMLFGTFRNPVSVEGLEAGFYRGASRRIGAMLAFRDVSRRAGRPALTGPQPRPVAEAG